MKKIIVIGHLSPDLDAVASAVAYADLLTVLKDRDPQHEYKDLEVVPVIPGDINKETHFVFEKFGIELPKRLEDIEIKDEDKFILVDHNEEAQRHTSVAADKIIELIDHHKANINFTSPLKMDIRPIGSTCSVIYEKAKEQNVKLSDKAKSLILSAIISDTIALKSPTTKHVDEVAVKELCQTLEINLEDLAMEIFKAKSDLSGMSASELVKKDYKVFDFVGKKVFIGQVETVEPAKVLEQISEIITALEKVKTAENVDQAYLFITDILKLNSQAVYVTEEEGNVLSRAFASEAKDNIVNAGSAVSRKKDMAPAIERALN